MKRMRKGLDRKIFRNTAERTRSINLSPRAARGGIRL